MHFGRDAVAREIADHRGKDVIVRRVDVIEDHLGQRALAFQRVQVGGQRRALRVIANRVKAGIWSQLAQQARVVVAERAEVKLLGPALVRVEPPEEQHHESAELPLLCRRGCLAPPSPAENGRGSLEAAEVRVALAQAVIRQPAALRVEVIMACLQRFQQLSQVRDIRVSGFL